MKETREAMVRSVAVQAERHWWVRELAKMRDGFRGNAALNPQSEAAWDLAANALDVLVAERAS